MQKAYSLGIHRDDGDFQILATFNNMDELVHPDEFEAMVQNVTARLSIHTGEPVVALQREDATDYVNLDIGD